MLQIMMGTDWQENQRMLLQSLCSGLREETPRVLIVPEQMSFSMEQKLCALGGSTICRYAEVLSFSRLANRVFSLEGGIAGQVMDQGGRLMAMALALEQVRPRLKFFSSSSTKIEFLTQMVQAIDELKCYCIDADQLRQASARLSGRLAQKLEELALILESYDAVCSGDRQDPRDRLTKLCDALQDSDYAAGRQFYFDGFIDFTGEERKIIGQLLSAGAPVTMALCCDGPNFGLPVFSAARHTLQQMLCLAEECGAGVQMIEVPSALHGELHQADQALWNAAEPQPAPSQAIHLLECNTAHEEAEKLASVILQLTRQGFRYRDIHVACAGFPSQRPIYEAVLAKYQIPSFFSGGKTILEKPVIGMLLAALEAVVGGMETGAVLRYLKAEGSPLTPEACDRLENYAVTWNIYGKRWEEDWTMHPGGYGLDWEQEDRQLLEQVNAARVLGLKPLLTLKQSMAQAKNTGEQVLAIYTFLEQCGIEERLLFQEQQLLESGMHQRAQEYHQLYDTLLQALEQIHAVLGHTVRTGESCFRLLKTILSQYATAAIPATLDCVTVGAVADLRHQAAACVVVTGCEDGKFPAYDSGGGLLSDGDRECLRRIGLHLSPSGGDRVERELAGIRSVLSGASEHLFLLHSGQPSYLLQRLYQSFPQRDAAWETALLPADFSMDAAAASFFLRTNPPAAPQRLLEPMQDLQLRAGYQPGQLKPETVQGLYGEQLRLSASRIDQFSACRQAFFLRYGLKAKPRQRADFDARLYGTFVHAVLEYTVRRVQERGGFAGVPEAQVEAIARAAMEEVASQMLAQAKLSQRDAYLFHRNFDEAMQVVRELARELRRSQFVPVACELEFSAGGAMEPVQVQGSRASAVISGAVDRVDLFTSDSAAFVRVVDYKTGRKEFDYTDLLSGMGLQMLIYLFALEQNGQAVFGQALQPAGVLYFPARVDTIHMQERPNHDVIEKERAKRFGRKGLLYDNALVLSAMEPEEGHSLPYHVNKKGERSGDLMDSSQLAMLRRYVRNTLADLTDTLAAGNVLPNPYFRGSEHSACQYCVYADACHLDICPDQRRYLASTDQKAFWDSLKRKEEAHG